LVHEPRPVQHRHVLLHRREAHRVVLRERRHRQFLAHAAAHDVAAGGVGQRVEQVVHDLVGQLIYNHLVVC